MPNRNHRRNISSRPSDLQWLEDGINFLGAWMKDTLFSGKPESRTPARKTRGRSTRHVRRHHGRRIMRIREREIDIYLDD